MAKLLSHFHVFGNGKHASCNLTEFRNKKNVHRRSPFPPVNPATGRAQAGYKQHIHRSLLLNAAPPTELDALLVAQRSVSHSPSSKETAGFQPSAEARLRTSASTCRCSPGRARRQPTFRVDLPFWKA